MGAASVLRLQRARILALVLTALSLGVVGVSAFLRLYGAGLGCADWPACYGQLLAEATYSPPPLGRLVQRIVATSALLLTIALAWYVLRPQPLRPVARHVLILLGLMLFLSVVGIWSADPRLALVNFVNVLGGLALVSMSWRIVMASDGTATQDADRPDPLLAAGSALLTATVILGALIGARYAAAACVTLPFCGDSTWPAAAGGYALNPVATLAGPTPAGDAGGVALHLLHRYSAVIAVLLLGLAALRRLRRPAAWVLLGLLGLEVLLGALTVNSGSPLWTGVGHNIAAAALLAGAAQLRRT
ncbi:MAG: COX15/CtaA family protein [Betaproteobacteria bacterium]|nr:COX15/CtaA family protein [Betaproteobacteria bacterium]